MIPRYPDPGDEAPQNKTSVALKYVDGEWHQLVETDEKKRAQFLVTTTCEVRDAWRQVHYWWGDYQDYLSGHYEWNPEEMELDVELFPLLWKAFQEEVEYIWSGEYEDKATIRRYNVPNCVPIQGGRIHPDGVEPVLDPNGMRRIY